jgi:hypothetical protein
MLSAPEHHCTPSEGKAMTEFLSKFDGGELIGLVAVAGGLLCGLVCGTTAIVMDHWCKLRQMALTQDLVSRGMSAEEIQAVLDAGSGRSRKTCRSEQITRT